MSHLPLPRESYCDVLINGAGPAGCVAALALAKAGIKARLIDKRDCRVQEGHADGLRSLSMDVFESLGVARDILKSSRPMLKLHVWGPDSDGKLVRKDANYMHDPAVQKHLPQALGQGPIEQALLDAIKAHNGTADERGILPTSLAIDSEKSRDPASYAVTVKVQHLEPDEIEPTILRAHTADAAGNLPNESLFRGRLVSDWKFKDTLEKVSGRTQTEEIIHAKYLIAADGAHSWVRSALGIAMEGDRSDFVWGVLDCYAITDFPDVQVMNHIRSKAGNILLIARENGLTRLYVPLFDTAAPAGEKVDIAALTPQFILKRAQAIMHPYTFSYQKAEWWTAYTIGQRVAQRFADPSQRVFLVGDAVHTHSPKEGLGMNTSMADSFNLAWKIAGVLKHQLDPAILDTYEYERRIVAQDLITLDRCISGAMSRGDPDYPKYYMANMGFMTGKTIRYSPSLIVAEPSLPFDVSAVSNIDSDARDFVVTCLKEPDNADKIARSRVQGTSELATSLPLGIILPDTMVVRHADGAPMFMTDLHQADGRWRILVFGGGTSDAEQLQRINHAGEQLESGVLSRYRDCLTTYVIHSLGESSNPGLGDFHRVFFPLDPRLGHDYKKIHRDEKIPVDSRCGAAYSTYGIDRTKGCIVVVRPDRFVAHLAALDNVASLDAFFAEFMLPTTALTNGHA